MAEIFTTFQPVSWKRERGRIFLSRIHSDCRCIDGLILPDQGKTRQQFKSRTELFIGAEHHGLMSELYDIRSAVEHLHVDRYLEPFDRNLRLDLLKKESIVEHVARTSLIKLFLIAACLLTSPILMP